MPPLTGNQSTRRLQKSPAPSFLPNGLYAGRHSPPALILKIVIQEDPTGCGIACAAMLAGLTYREMKKAAAAIGVTPEHPALWETTRPMIALLEQFGMRPAKQEIEFSTWNELPRLALLAIKWHLAPTGTPAWHWVVFRRDPPEAIVLDPASSLAKNIRTDFGRMNPKWFIKIPSSTS
jgi:ABC-type bacteriocin/lantibiotic exporter with double-glycine peptidase domain